MNGSREHNMVIDFKRTFVYSIIKDPSDIPARRYKMIFNTFGEEALWSRHHSALNLAYSHDGLQWERPRHVNPVLRGISDDNCTLFYDPDRRKYVLMTRRVPNVPRDISQYESYDLVNWEDTGRVLVAGDDLDPPELYNIYDMPVFRYGNFFLGLINPYYVHPFAPTYGAYHKPPDYPRGKVGQLELSLAYSRDGRTWNRPDDRSPVVPVGKPGAQDGGMLYPAENPLVRDGETLIYYTASRLNHTWWDWLSYDLSQGTRDVAVLMLARMPEDHWISLNAGEEEGWLMTKPWGPAYEILVNADAEGGSIEAELITPYGRTGPEDFTRADSVPLTSRRSQPEADLEERPFALRPERGAIWGCLPQALSHAGEALFLHLHAARSRRRSGPAPGQRPLAGRDHAPLRSLGPRLQRAGSRGSPASPPPVQPRRGPGRLRQADAGFDPQQEMRERPCGAAVSNRRTPA